MYTYSAEHKSLNNKNVFRKMKINVIFTCKLKSKGKPIMVVKIHDTVDFTKWICNRCFTAEITSK